MRFVSNFFIKWKYHKLGEMDPSQDRCYLTAFTNEWGRNKLIGAVYLRPRLLKSIEVIKTQFSKICLAVSDFLIHLFRIAGPDDEHSLNI